MYDRHENMPLAQFLRAPLCLLGCGGGGASALANSQRASSTSFGKYACTKLLSNNHPPQNNKYFYTRPRVVKKKKITRCSTRKKNCTAQISTYARVFCAVPRRGRDDTQNKFDAVSKNPSLFLLGGFVVFDAYVVVVVVGNCKPGKIRTTQKKKYYFSGTI